MVKLKMANYQHNFLTVFDVNRLYMAMVKADINMYGTIIESDRIVSYLA